MPADDKTVLMPPPDAVAVGTQLSGTYELDQRIAAGGMGEVFKGHNIQTGDPVAIKIVLPEFARDSVILALFRKEASILNHLSHEAIVRYHVFAIDQALGRPYLAMEFVDGVSLADMFANGPMPAEEARTLLHKVASGLAAAHEAGVIHRDLSPDNIILPGGKVGRAKIIDFGIARSANVGGETLLGGVFAGKYNFVSPEQLGMYGGEVTDRSDIYSLGLVMAAALRGASLNMSGSQVEVIEKRRVVPELSAVDESLRPIIAAMLQPNPADRPEGMAEIADWVAPVRTARPSFETTHKGAVPHADSTVRQPNWTEAPAQGPAATQPPAAPAAQPTVIAPPPEPVSESPFGPYVGPANIPIPDPVTPPAPPSTAESKGGKKRGAIAAIVLTALAASVAGVIWYGGFADGLIGKPPATPPVTDEPATTAPPVTDEPGTTTPPVTDEPGTTTPPVTEEPGTTTPTVTDQPGTTTPPVTEEPGTTTPTVTDQPGTSTPPVTDEPGTTIPPVTDEPGTTTPPVTDQPGTTTPPATDEPETTAPPVTDQPGTTTPPVTDEPGTTTPPVTDQPGTTTPPVTDTPPDAIEEPVAPIDKRAEPVEWLKNYAGGDCFYAIPISIADAKAEIEGFGDSVEAFKGLLSDYQAKFNIEPDIQVRLIRPRQCPITALLGTLGRGDTNPPNLSLVKYELANRDPMVGEVQMVSSRETYLLLVDHDGIVHNLDRLMTRNGDVAKFDVALGLGTSKDKSPVPQVLVAVSTSQPVQAMETSDPVAASELFPRLLSEIKDKNIDAAASARYFRIRE